MVNYNYGVMYIYMFFDTLLFYFSTANFPYVAY